MNNYHGMIFAYKSYPELRELVATRTAASLPICSKYRLIDFALSSMKNAGITDVGVIMQQDYQSLLDHLSNGKAWDMSKKKGGLKLLPPFGLPEFHKGNYSGTLEALNAVSSYVKAIPQDNIVIMIGNLCANIDLSDVIKTHEKTKSDITSICADYTPDVLHHRYIVNDRGQVTQILFDRIGPGEGIPALECFIVKKSVLLTIMDKCKSQQKVRFHKDGLTMFLNEGGTIQTYVHKTYARIIKTVDGYFDANMNMLDAKNRAALFPANRPVRTTYHDEPSTYYGTQSYVKDCLVSDGCVIEGKIENCIIFPGVTIGEGAELKNCILMKQTTVEPGAELNCVIADKFVTFSSGITLTGNVKLPIVVPEYSII